MDEASGQPPEPWLAQAWFAYLEGPEPYRAMCAVIGCGLDLPRERFRRYFAARWAAAKRVHCSLAARARPPQIAREKIPREVLPDLWDAYCAQELPLRVLALRYGVAASTVHRALNDHYGSAYRMLAAQRPHRPKKAAA